MKNKQLNRIEQLLDRLDAAIVVRDPGNARATDAYDALRKQLNLTVKSHRAHVAHLLSLSDSLSRNASLELIQDRVSDFLAELGIKYIGVFVDESPELFEIIETIEGSQDSYEISEPAVIEELDGGGLILLRQGKARQIRRPVTPSVVTTPELSEPSEPSEPSELSEPELKSFSLFESIALSGITLIIGLLLGVFVLSGKDDSSQNPAQTTIPSTVINTSTTISSVTSTTAATTNPTKGN